MHAQELINLNQSKTMQGFATSRVIFIKKKTMNAMKQYFLLLAAALLLAACSIDDDDSSIATNPYQENQGETNRVPLATYEADWVIDRKVTDHTTMKYDGHIQISHFPNRELLKWKDRMVDSSGKDGADGIEFDIDINDGKTDASIAFDNTGNTTQQLYFESTTLTSYQIDMDGTPYTVHLDSRDGSPTAVYDQKADRWMITWLLTGITLTDDETGKTESNTFTPVKTMMLVTTKRTE